MANIKRFSPNWSDPNDLEAITIAREEHIAGAVESIRESALTKNKHHLLFVGPRGSGKTHLVTLVNHRLSQMGDLADNLRIAWLNEDETSDTLLSLLLRAHRALAKDYPNEFPSESTQPVYDQAEKTAATEVITNLILEQLGNKTLLMVVENLDAIFHDFSNGEDKLWRALMQDYPKFCTLATAQRLVQEISSRNQPFFGFFQVQTLKPFTVEEARSLLAAVAIQNDEPDLAELIQSPRGFARIRALHHLTGGNQRLFIILSEFLNCENLDTLVQPFEELVDEQLTPYYQERLRWLPTLQRRIVEFLCTTPQPTSVKDIARNLFATSQTISSQLKDLKEIGYLISHKRGRESLYELADPLMRLSRQVKEAKGSIPLRILVDFLRVWYDRTDLEDRLSNLPADANTSKVYFTEALRLIDSEGNYRLKLFQNEAEGINPTDCSEEQLDLLRDLTTESQNPEHFVAYSIALLARGDFETAQETVTTHLSQIKENDRALHYLTSIRAFTLNLNQQYELALKDFTKVIEELENEKISVFLRFYRAKALTNLAQYTSAIDDLSSCLKNPPRGIPSATIRLSIAENLAQLGQWEDVFPHLEHFLEQGMGTTKNPITQSEITILEQLFEQGRTQDFWEPKIENISKIYSAHKKENRLIANLLLPIKNFENSSLDENGLRLWLALWQKQEGRLGKHLDIANSLIKIGIDYLTSNKDPAILLELPQELRTLAEQVLEIEQQ